MSLSGPEFQPEPLRPTAGSPIRQESRPPSMSGDGDRPPSAESSTSKRSRWPLWGALAAVAAAVAIGYAALIPAASDERDSPNWKYVQAAQQSAADGHPVQWRKPGGTALPSAGIIIGQQDRDLETTQRVRDALLARNLKLADQLAFHADAVPSPVVIDPASSMPPQASQPDKPPEPAAEPKLPEATLSSGMRAEIERGDVEFYHIYLYDSCYEDGDVVEILIDGQPMFLTPIGNKGATVSVPISKTRTTVISVRGIFDGGGGITVGCRTSQGDGFVKSMVPDEIQPLSVVFPK